MKTKNIVLGIMGLFLFFISIPTYGEQTIVVKKVDNPPVIDGNGNDPAWEKAQDLRTHDNIANIDVNIKSVYSEGSIFFMVSYPDPDESRSHKSWVWNKDKDMYEMGPDREDVFIIKWNMDYEQKNLSIFADNSYTADIWFWKACRTGPTGFADDKIQRLSAIENSKSMELSVRSGKTMFLTRRGDKGKQAYKNNIYMEYNGDIIPQFTNQIPEGSRADIRAKGSWSDGKWTIEFGRKLNTGHDDDIQLLPGKQFQVGISRYEIAGRLPDPRLTQTLYGSGDISENLFLIFEE